MTDLKAKLEAYIEKIGDKAFDDAAVYGHDCYVPALRVQIELDELKDLLWPAIEAAGSLCEKAEADIRMQQLTNGKSFVNVKVELMGLFDSLAELEAKLEG